MAGIGRVHGQIENLPNYNGYTVDDGRQNVTGASGSFISGYQPLFIRVIADNPVFTADSVDAKNVITDGGRTKAIRIINTFGSILMVDLGGNTSNVVVMVDAASFNSGNSMNGSDYSFGALTDALVQALGSSYDVNWAIDINANGTLDW